MESALAEIEFLTRSANRVTVLQRLAEGPQTRRDLAAATGASQATLGRILGDFEDRSWIERDGSDFEATATGRLVASGLTELLECLETERELRGLVAYLPSDAMDFDLRHLADATITTPTETRPNAPIRRALDLLDDADEALGFSHAFNSQMVTRIATRVDAGELTFHGVFSRDAIEALAEDSELRDRLTTLLAAESAQLRVRDEEIPIAVTVIDDVVHLLLRDASGALQGSIDADDPTVRDWADEKFQQYWDSAAPLTPDDI